jgi:DNA-binding transcriptional MerR regulator
MGEKIPDKLFFSIGEVSEIAGIKAYILRYWESEFNLLHPEKDAGGQRSYKKEDIEIIFRLRKLLYEEGYTIAGAKKKLKEEKKRDKTKSAEKKEVKVKKEKIKKKREKIKKELKDLLGILEKK